MNKNLYAVFQEHFPRDLSQTFLETEDGSCYSYRDLEQETARYASVLNELGLEQGDRLIAQVEKSPQLLFLYLAALRAGVIYLPLNPAYRKNELQYIFSDAEPKAVVCSPSLLPLWRELIGDALRNPQGLPCDSAQGPERKPTGERGQGATASERSTTHNSPAKPKPECLPQTSLETMDVKGGGSLADRLSLREPSFSTVPCAPDDLAAILYTSGTTGRPKGAMITHRNLVANGEALYQFWHWTVNDVLIHALPLFHAHGLFLACSCALLSSAKIIFLSKFDSHAVMQHLPKATVFMGVPTYYTRLLERPEFTRELCHGMRLFISGSAPLLEQTFLAFQQRTGHAILDRYGLTETGGNCSPPVAGPHIPGTVGVPLPRVTIRLTDENGAEVPVGEVGSIEIRGDHVFFGYWRKPADTAAAFTADGYFKTGDLGKLSANGYLSIVGRSTDLVISGGLNVYPKEIETAIDQMEGVAESAVIGVPHPDFGEAVVAVVVREKGGEDLTESQIVAELKEVLANYKIPKRVFFANELPRNTMGKVQKNILRKHSAYRSVFEQI